MIFDAIITLAAVSALFGVKKFYRLSMFVWFATNSYWFGSSYSGGRYFEAAMFFAFVVSTGICIMKK